MTTDTTEVRLRRVLAEHDRYLTAMMNSDPRGADMSDYLNASFDLYARLAAAGFGDLSAQQQMHADVLDHRRDLLDEAAGRTEQTPVPAAAFPTA